MTFMRQELIQDIRNAAGCKPTAGTLYKAINLPTKLADLEVKRDELKPVVEKALTVEDIKFVPYTVTDKMLFDAIDKLEEYNKTH